jgi:heme oxygenase
MVSAVAPNVGFTASRMLARLGAESETLLDVVDDALVGSLIKPTRSSYRYMLARVYGFEAPVGTALLHVPNFDANFARPRIRSGRLAADLIALTITPPEQALLARRHQVPVIHNAGEALGWLYVLERLAQRIAPLSRHLHDRLPGELVHAGSYLQSAHEPSLFGLGDALDLLARTTAMADRIAAGASAGFRSLEAWISSTPPWDGF